MLLTSDWQQVLRSSRVSGFETGESTDENDSDQGGRSRVFRPWQAQDQQTTTYDYQADSESGSDGSVVPPTRQVHSKTTPKKVYTKKAVGGVTKQTLTEKVKQNRNNKSQKTLPAKNSKHSMKGAVLTSKKSHSENESRRTSSLPDLTRGGDKNRLTVVANRPISEQQTHSLAEN